MEAAREKQLSHITSVPLPSILSATFLPQGWGQGGMEGAEECLAALSALSSFTWRSFLVLASLISSSPAVAVGSPGKSDCREHGMVRGEANANLILQGIQYFYECCEACGILLLLLWP